MAFELGDISSWLPGAIFALFAIFALETWLRNRGLPPGPWGFPFFGYYPFISPVPHEKLYELSKKYGEIISIRSVGGSLFIILHGLPLITEVIVTRADEVIGRPIEANILTWLDDSLSMGSTEGSAWNEQRRFFLSAAKNYGFGKMEFEGFIHEMIQNFFKQVHSYGNKSFPVATDISILTCNVMSEILCKKRFSKDDRMFWQLQEGFRELATLFRTFGIFITGPVLKYGLFMLTPTAWRLQKTKKGFEALAKEVVEEHVRTFDPGNLRDVIDSTLNHMKSLEEKGQLKNSSFSMKRLEMNFMILLIEGAETTGSVLTCLLLELALHEDVQKKAQKEIDEVVAHGLPSWIDRPNLPYLEAVVFELCRIAFPFNLSPYYSNFEEMTIRGYRIPKRSFILFNYWGIYHDPKVFPEPFKFNPDRFIGEDGQRLRLEGPMPFGIGKRSCLGKPLAQMEIFVIIASIIQNFTVRPGDKDGEIRMEPRAKFVPQG